MFNVKKNLALLGLPVKDKVTKYTGIIISISFELYGCIQALVDPGLDEKGDFKQARWFDVNRLDVIDAVPVMEPPEWEFDNGFSEGKHGPAEKPNSFEKPINSRR